MKYFPSLKNYHNSFYIHIGQTKHKYRTSYRGININNTYPLFVRLLVEVIEQEVEHDGVQQNDPGENFREIAFDEQQLRRVDEHHNELDLQDEKTKF